MLYSQIPPPPSSGLLKLSVKQKSDFRISGCSCSFLSINPVRLGTFLNVGPKREWISMSGIILESAFRWRYEHQHSSLNSAAFCLSCYHRLRLWRMKQFEKMVCDFGVRAQCIWTTSLIWGQFLTTLFKENELSFLFPNTLWFSSLLNTVRVSGFITILGRGKAQFQREILKGRIYTKTLHLCSNIYTDIR